MTASFISAGTGQPLIFLHGIGSTGRVWQHQVDYFSKDYLCVGLDLPSYGETPALPENTFEALSHWLKDLMDQNEWHEAILVGNSYGGMIVQEFLYHYPETIKAAVLFGTSPAFGKKDGEWQKAFIEARLKPLEEGLSMAEMAPDMVDSLMGSAAQDEGKKAALKDIARVSEEAYRTAVMTLPSFDRRKNLPNIKIPTLLLVGEEDQNSPSAMMKKTSTYIPNSSFVELSGLGHIAHIEDPFVFNRALENFLGGV